MQMPWKDILKAAPWLAYPIGCLLMGAFLNHVADGAPTEAVPYLKWLGTAMLISSGVAGIYVLGLQMVRLSVGKS